MFNGYQGNSKVQARDLARPKPVGRWVFTFHRIIPPAISPAVPAPSHCSEFEAGIQPRPGHP